MRIEVGPRAHQEGWFTNTREQYATQDVYIPTRAKTSLDRMPRDLLHDGEEIVDLLTPLHLPRQAHFTAEPLPVGVAGREEYLG